MVSIISYNTHLFGKSGPSITEYFEDDRREHEIINRIKSSNADIVCLCEVWYTAYKKDIINKTGYPYSYYASSGIERMGDGLVILSKLPLTNVKFTKFDKLTGSDDFSEKGFISATVYVNENKSFRLFFAHTQANDDQTAIRATNLAQIQKDIEAFYPGVPAIIVGDLNVPAIDSAGNSNEYQSMLSTFSSFADSWDVKNHGQVVSTCDPNNNLAKKFDQTYPARYDYALVTIDDWDIKRCEVITDWKVEVGGTVSDCSDHYPISIEISQRKDAIIPLLVFDTQDEALKQAQTVKAAYGNGASNLIVFHNGTQYPVKAILSYSWDGSYQLIPSPVVPAGKYCAVFHHHPDGEATQSKGGFIFRIEGDASYDIFCGFIARWSAFYQNKVYTELRETGHWGTGPLPLYADTLSNLLENSAYSHEDRGPQQRFVIKGQIDKGDSPITSFSIEG